MKISATRAKGARFHFTWPLTSQTARLRCWTRTTPGRFCLYPEPCFLNGCAFHPFGKHGWRARARNGRSTTLADAGGYFERRRSNLRGRQPSARIADCARTKSTSVRNPRSSITATPGRFCLYPEPCFLNGCAFHPFRKHGWRARARNGRSRTSLDFGGYFELSRSNLDNSNPRPILRLSGI